MVKKRGNQTNSEIKTQNKRVQDKLSFHLKNALKKFFKNMALVPGYYIINRQSISTPLTL